MKDQSENDITENKYKILCCRGNDAIYLKEVNHKEEKKWSSWANIIIEGSHKEKYLPR